MVFAIGGLPNVLFVSPLASCCPGPDPVALSQRDRTPSAAFRFRAVHCPWGKHHSRSRLNLELWGVPLYRGLAGLSTGRSWVGYARLDLRLVPWLEKVVLSGVLSGDDLVELRIQGSSSMSNTRLPVLTSYHLRGERVCSPRTRNLIVGTGSLVHGDVLPRFPSREPFQWTPMDSHGRLDHYGEAQFRD